MSIALSQWKTPTRYLAAKKPDIPVLFFAPAELHKKTSTFLDGFPGLTTYAVKANPEPVVITNLVAAGVTAFDVASPWEIQLLRRLAPSATLHYHNPVRSRQEIQLAWENEVKSYAIDRLGELEKLASIIPPSRVEISVRFKLPAKGAIYDFGSKFGASPDEAVALLKKVQSLGYLPSLTFHPGTQCQTASPWQSYIQNAAKIATSAGVQLHRLNIGGGFPSHRNGKAPDLPAYFRVIDQAMNTAFGTNRPALVCEPGRGIVAESCILATRIKSLSENGHIYLNDGIYGGLSELASMVMIDRISVISPTGQSRTGARRANRIFGPTCDSLDVLPEKSVLPSDIAEEDYLIIPGMGAYSNGLNTAFNGYGAMEMVMVERAY